MAGDRRKLELSKSVLLLASIYLPMLLHVCVVISFYCQVLIPLHRYKTICSSTRHVHGDLSYFQIFIMYKAYEHFCITSLNITGFITLEISLSDYSKHWKKFSQRNLLVKDTGYIQQTQA